MDRADKIFTILSALALVAVLLWQRKAKGPAVNIPALPALITDQGPAYLLSNLPAQRVRDDYAQPVSYPEYLAS